MNVFQVYLSFYRHVVSYWFGNRKSKIIVRNFFKLPTFRLSEKSNKLFPALRMAKQVLTLLKNKTPNAYELPTNGIACFDGAYKSRAIRETYLNGLVKQKPTIYFFRNRLYAVSRMWFSVCLLLNTIACLILIMPLNLFASEKQRNALIILELAETVLLLRLLKQQKIEYLYFFCGYERDSNFMAYCIQKSGIRVNKIPSGNPLKNYYAYLYTDELSITSPSHKYEIEQLKDNWICEQINKYPPFNYTKVLNITLNSKQEKPKYNIGYISSAAWDRVRLKDIDSGLGSNNAEFKSLSYLYNFLSVNSREKLFIYLHPREKKTKELITKAIDYYKSQFKEVFDRVHIYTGNKSTIELFSTVNLAISAHSSANFERLFAGYKAMFVPYGMPEDYFAHTGLNNISARTYEDFERLLNEILSLTNEQYYKKYGLQEFHYKSYNL